jgi:hypothetical protein
MFFGMMLVDAALAAWAVGLMQQPGAPRWVRYLLGWLAVTLVLSVALVLGSSNIVSEKNASLLGPAGAVVALVALIVATLIQQRASKGARR